MTILVTDNFNRADANPIGTPWITAPSDTPLAIVSNVVELNTAVSQNEFVSYYSGIVWPNDQWAQVKIVNLNNAGYFYGGVAVRQSSIVQTRYSVLVGSSFDPRYYVRKTLAGAVTNLAFGSYAWTAGDVVYLEVVGTTITFKVNGIVIASVVDVDIPSGFAGVSIDSGTIGSSVQIDDFSGGDFSAPPVVPTSHGTEILWTLDFDGIQDTEGKTNFVPWAKMIRKLYEQLARQFNSLVDYINSGIAGAVTSVFGRTGVVVAQAGDYTQNLITAGAIANGSTATTQAPGDNTTKLATDAFVEAAIAGITSPVTSVFGRTGAVVAATNDYTQTQIASGAIANGSTATTQAALDASTKVSTDAYVDSAVGVETTRALAAEALLAPSASVIMSRRLTLISADGVGSSFNVFGEPTPTTTLGGGTNAVEIATVSPAFGPSIFISTPSSGVAVGWNGAVKNYITGRNISFLFIGYINNIITERAWIGMTDQTLATMAASDNPAGNYAAFRYSSIGGDTSWKCITKDATTQTIVSSGIAPVNDVATRFNIIFNDLIPNVAFYINGVLVATITTHLPTTATKVQWNACSFNTAGSGANGIGFEQLNIQENF